METNETNNGMANEQGSEATNAMQQKLEQNRLRLLQLNEAMRKANDALNKVQSEIEALKSGGQL